MNRKAQAPVKPSQATGQAVAEIAIFGALLLLVLGVLLSYTRSFREQQLFDQQIFRQALYDAYNYEFEFEDSNGETQTGYGRSRTYSKTTDKQAGVIFQPNRRSYSSSYSVYWSGAMEPPDSSATFINQDEVIMPPERKLVIFRTDDAEDIPEEELKTNTADVLAVIAPFLADSVIWMTSTEWYAEWAGGSALPASLALPVKVAAFAYLTSRYDEVTGILEAAEQNRKDLKSQDDDYQTWGWRVSNDDDDEGTSGMQLDRSIVSNVEGGKWYVKEISAQVYDTVYNASTEYTSTEDKIETETEITNVRQIDLIDTVNRDLSLRFDMTGPDSTIDYNLHDFDESPDDVIVNQGYGANGAYEESNVGTTATKRTQWVTKH